jgi:hypothetical protein
MAVKMTGAQYKAFLASNWGPDAMWEETEIFRNGERVPEEEDSDPSLYADGDIITIAAGTIIPDQDAPAEDIVFLDAVKFARKWLKAQNTVTLMVDVPREHADRFAQMIAEIGINSARAKVTRVGS